MNIGAAIKSVRIQRGLSQEELSLGTGLSQTSISQLEKGHKQPTKKTLIKICKALEIPESVLYIIGMEDADVPDARKKAYDKLYPQIKELAIEIIGVAGKRLI